MNRYFTREDENISAIDNFRIPRVWWSRPYEYCFALNHVNANDTILDVGCGLEHPFKHALGNRCKKAVAIDINPLVTNIKDENVDFVCADILDFKTDLKFDKIFIISTFEETQDFMVEKFKNMVNILAEGGKVIITSDYPSLDPMKLIKYAKEAKLVPTTQFKEEIPENALYHSAYKLNCYNVILEVEKKEIPKTFENRKTKVEKDYKTKVTKPKQIKKLEGKNEHIKT